MVGAGGLAHEEQGDVAEPRTRNRLGGGAIDNAPQVVALLPETPAQGPLEVLGHREAAVLERLIPHPGGSEQLPRCRDEPRLLIGDDRGRVVLPRVQIGRQRRCQLQVRPERRRATGVGHSAASRRCHRSPVVELPAQVQRDLPIPGGYHRIRNEFRADAVGEPKPELAVFLTPVLERSKQTEEVRNAGNEPHTHRKPGTSEDGRRTEPCHRPRSPARVARASAIIA